MRSLFSLVLIIFCYTSLYAQTQEQRSHVIMVSVAPYKYFVDALVEETAKVVLLVPPGASFHTYEPTPKQIIEGSRADIWFRIGETFEGRALQALLAHNPKMKAIDLRTSVDLITVDAGQHCCCCCHPEGADLHIWLSPKMSKRQVEQMAQVLISVYPEYRERYQKNAERLLANLDALDTEIREILSPLKNRTILVSHPAYAYFARDYQLTQLPIEFEGKDPTPRQLTDLLIKARTLNSKVVYIQNQYSSKGAYLIAKELDAKVVNLDPYSSGDYFKSLRDIALQIAAQQQ